MASPEPTPHAPAEADGQGNPGRPSYDVTLFGFRLLEFTEFPEDAAEPSNCLRISTPSIDRLSLALYVVGMALVKTLPPAQQQEAASLLAQARVKIGQLADTTEF